ncbi:MAG: hypothetical protein ACQESC_00530 [Nanobdellota archaeon]
MTRSTIVIKKIKSNAIISQLEKTNIPYHMLEPKGEYERLRIETEKGLLILYTSNKLVIQAKSEQEDFFKKLFSISDNHLQRKINNNTSHTKHNKTTLDFKKYDGIIGSDETLKGDTFGGLVVCAFMASREEQQELKRMGVVDSKELSDSQISRIATHIISTFSSNYHCISLDPIEYNTIIKSKGSSTSLLNDLHHQVISRIQSQQCDDGKARYISIVDKFPGCNIGDVIIPKAEQESVVVATASIIARKKGLDQIKELSEKAGFFLPLGSTHVKEALKRLIVKNKDLKEFCKLHFSNVKNVLFEKRDNKN